MQHSGDTFETAITILQLRGEVEPNNNPRYMRNVYRDEKVEITAFVDIVDQLIKEVSIRLFLPKGDSPGVLVYTWDRFVRQFRPGRWTTYLRTTARAFIAESTTTQLQQLGTESIDDSLLFPDIE